LITGINDKGDNEKNFEIGRFFIFCGAAVGVSNYIHIMIFYSMFALRCRQADFVASVSSLVLLKLVKIIAGVVVTGNT
jgi:hypothetical protein